MNNQPIPEDISFSDLHWAGKIMVVIMIPVLFVIAEMIFVVFLGWLWKAMTWAWETAGPY